MTRSLLGRVYRRALLLIRAIPMAIGFVAASAHADAGVCAKVRLALTQDAVATRTAFRATLDIENNDAANPLTGIQVQVFVTDLDNRSANAIFEIQGPQLSNLSAVDGTGVISAASEASASWTLVPSVDAASTGATIYKVSGRLRYSQAGASVNIPLDSTPITVQPDAALFINYFHQRDVLSDDPFTTIIEPAQPYYLVAQIENRGIGIAHNLSLTSPQPKIVDNEKGLLINFQVVGASVDGRAFPPSLTADFGDLAPGQRTTAIWSLTSSLQGLFTEYNATMQYLNGLGGKQFSSFQDVEIHEMIRLVQAPGAFEDGKPDFLVNDIPDPPLDLPDTLYLSDGSTSAVQIVTSGTVLGALSPGSLVVTQTAVMPSGWSYLRVPDPGSGQYQLKRVVRSDGVQIYFGTNAWTTDRTFIGMGKAPIYENIFHLLDYNSTGNYTLFYAVPPAADTSPPASSVAALPPGSYPNFSVNWSGADEAGGSGLAFFDIYTSDNGAPFAPWLQRTALTSAVFQGVFGHTYAFYSRATDLAGNTEPSPYTPQATTLVNKTNSPPVFAAFGPQSVDEGQTLVFDLPVTDPNGDPLSFSFLTTPPAGMALNTATGRVTWPTVEADGPSTNLIAVLATDNGFPPLSATGLVTVIVNEINQAPILAAITNYTIDEGFLLVITNIAFDADIPANKLAFSLGAGAPRGASLNTTNGVFSWRPDSTQGPSTNVVSVSVKDDGVPPLSATQQFTVIVRDVLPDFTVGIGRTNLMVGESSFVPVTLASTLDLVSLGFHFTADTGRLTNVALQPVAPEITSAALQSLGTNGYAVSFTLNPALQGDASRTLARLTFTAAPAVHSAILPLGLSDMTASRQSGIPVMQIGANGGGVIVVGREPVLEMTPGPLLTLYGHPGANYAMQSATNLAPPVFWDSAAQFVLPGDHFQMSGLITNQPRAFYRARELAASDWQIGISSPGGQVTLDWASGSGGCGLEETASLKPPVVWTPAQMPVSVVNGRIRAVVPVTNQKFYRLACGGQLSCLGAPGGLVAWWPADGDGRDLAGTNNAVLTNGVGFALGKVGLAFSFDGVTGIVDAGTGPAITGTGPFAVCAWIKTSYTPYEATIVSQRDAASFNGEYSLRVRPDGGVFWTSFGDGQYGFNYESVGVVADQQWHHVAGVRETDGTGRIYIDGALDSSSAQTPRTLISAKVGIGGDLRELVFDSAHPLLFNGLIDEVQIFNRALTAAEVRAIFNAGNLGLCRP